MLVCHVVGVWVFVWVGVEGIVMAEDVLLDALVHVSAHGEEVLGAVLVPSHLLDPGLVAQQSLLVSHVTLHHFLVFLALLKQFLVETGQALHGGVVTSRALRI